MSFNVTSWFVQQAASENPPVRRKFTIAGSDYTNYVTQWPTISRQWNELRPNNVTISLANEDQTFNFFKTAKTNTQSSCSLKLGFTHPTSGDELIDMLTGKVTEVTFRDGAVSLKITDKIQQLSDRIIGQSNSAVVFSSATLLPSDVAWTLCTCYGGMSSVTSTSNPDIDYAAFQTWAAVFSADSVYVSANFTGQKVTEGLRKIMENTQSAVTVADDKVVFARWSTVNTRTVDLDSDEIKTLSVSVKVDGLVNKQWVEFSYNVTSKSWASSVFEANTASINSYGTRETVLKDESFWYVTSANALNAAQRSLFVNALPYDQVELTTILKPLHQQVGETIIAVDPHLGVTEGWRIMNMAVSLEDGSIKLGIDGSQVNTPFLLDYSALDGSDILV